MTRPELRFALCDTPKALAEPLLAWFGTPGASAEPLPRPHGTHLLTAQSKS